MRAEFQNKSRSKRKKIFLKRTERMMSDLLHAVSSRANVENSAEAHREIVKGLVDEVYASTTENIDHIFSDEASPEFTHDELVERLVAKFDQQKPLTA